MKLSVFLGNPAALKVIRFRKKNPCQVANSRRFKQKLPKEGQMEFLTPTKNGYFEDVFSREGTFLETPTLVKLELVSKKWSQQIWCLAGFPSNSWLDFQIQHKDWVLIWAWVRKHLPTHYKISSRTN